MNSSYAYAEVLEILDNMDSIYVNKIPEKFRVFLKDNASKNYKKHIEVSKDLQGQVLSPKTLSILALINLKFWVENEEHKQRLLARYQENDRKKMEKLSRAIDKNDYKVFDKVKEKEVYEEENSENLPIEKKTVFKRFIEYLKSLIFEN